MGARLVAWAGEVAARVFGPVFTLEAGRVARRPSTFLVRLGYLLILAGVLGMFFYSWRSDLRSPGGVVQPGVLTRFAENFFWTYSVTQFLVVCALAPAFTAAVVTDEKERKTLDFLLVTDLSGREIVFGKLAARVGILGTLVLSGVPVVALMQFFGGIEPRLLLLSCGMTLATVASLAAVGVAVSVQLARTRDAVVAAYALPTAYLILSALLADELRRAAPGWWFTAVEVFTAGNPFLVADGAGRTFGAAETPRAVVWYLAFHAVVAVLGLGFAAARLRKSAEQPAGAGAGPRNRAGRWVAWVLGRRAAARRHPAVSDAPVFWREVHVEPVSGGGVLSRVFAALVLAAVVVPFLNIVADALFVNDPYSYRLSRSPWGRFQLQTRIWVCSVTCGLGVLMLLRATARGAASVAGERDRDTWVSLLGTPLTAREILHGKWAGGVWGQRDALFLLAAVWAIGVLTGSVNPVFLAAAAVAFGVYLAAFSWLGVRCSVTAPNTRAAMSRALPLALLLGGGFWIVLGCCCAGVGVGGGGYVAAYVVALVAGATPPFVLAAFPAADFELLKDLRGELAGVFGALVVGVVGGTLGWAGFAHFWWDESLEALAADTNRNVNELPGVTRPSRARPPAIPPGSSDTAGPS